MIFKIFIFFIFVLIVFLIYLYEMRTFSKTKYIIEDNRIGNDFKIIHLSDLHNNKFLFDNELLMDKIKKENPDIIVVTGDIVMKRYDMQNSLLFMKQLTKIAPVYFVRGNHDMVEDNSPVMIKKLQKYGVIVCESKSFKLKNNITIHGLIDFLDEEFDNKEYIESEKIKNLNKLEIDKDKYNILLTHRPYDFDKYIDYNIDLTLCGHTHGGQWILPGLGGLISPDKKTFFPEYDYGLKEKNGKKMIINRGLGGVKWAIRLNNRPEIGIIILKHKK